MVFDLLLTSDVIHAYKPSPMMYQAALSALNLQPGEVALVAAHAYDLRAAREHGYRTIYVARDSELALEPEEELENRTKDFDLHLEGGLIHLARALGMEDDKADLL
ncbi:hypothetical protein EXIGLDRAFT_780237 [Exidia glandulosa HHB12029]|uniref:HAD-like protein n=1 Tax=Exidia glandulosa HHB12029 TaxID=1314781 RepID=A0A165ZAZ5_EXIGL|nr:hypothetical protein EXIGLDRAFT_780237 [Exidia glandulosa HHB12029]